MDKIWANRLIAGTRKWEEVPASREAGVRAELKARLDAGIITEEQYNNIFGIVTEGNE